MRILAVIPACEGSATLPNKNIRVIHGKPMIYYVINNAKCSRFITDIVVSTNSSEIVTIAKQMGVRCRQRDGSLCNKSVSLDAVVYDVFNEVPLTDYDYVVTMQSISPTLQVKSLDNALERCINEGWDTMISVTNRSRFYWTMTEAGAHPFQKKRMNRHCLPPFYVETGAFLITRARYVRPDSRIGPAVQLYELNGDEAIDVDTFSDLQQVDNIFRRKATAFYVNGNKLRGLGHVHRVLQIADELFTKPDIYFDSNETDIAVFGTTAHSLKPVDGPQGFVKAMSASHYDIIVNDILSTSRSYMQALRTAAPDARLINFEDDGEGARYADNVINALYESSPIPNVSTGSRYYIVPKLFLLYEPISIRPKVEDVLITFGGADPSGYTEQLLKIIAEPEFSHVRFHVVIGKAQGNAEELLGCAHGLNINMMHDISNMPEVMSQCDIAVTSRGRTGFELAVMGIPTISIAQNEREQKHDFISDKNGFTYLGYQPGEAAIREALLRYIGLSADERYGYQRLLLQHDLRNGRKNVMELLERA